ncbi:YcxB family protein [Klebsiella aerogenes]|uniref:YcxB family protein n=1 Tax=Klebsiella aerogenes TaxID=548 RepID=UPI002DB9F0FF|nr:YcxB family protein [Klebsiella aerogenes]MEB5742655.1 YcxB family protein [Klebsiella aerogenes]
MRDAVKTFVWRRGIFGQKALFLAEAVMIAFLIWLLSKSELAWLIGFVGATVLLAPCLMIVIWSAHYRNTVRKFHKMSSHRADFIFSNEGLEVTSGLGSAKIPWSGIIEIWEKSDYWMLFTGPNQFITLPVQTMTLADQAFFRSKAPSAIVV